MRFIHADALVGMSEIPDGSVDLCLTDPPYGLTQVEHDVPIPLKPMWEQLRRVMKPNGAILLFSQMPFTARLVSSNYEDFRYEWIWEKVSPSGHLNAKKMPMKAHENICVFYRTLPVYHPQMSVGKTHNSHTGNFDTENYGRFDPKAKDLSKRNEYYPRDVLKFGNVKGRGQLHPQQKPVDLLRYLIRTYSNEGDIVLDFTMGSGSCGVAAVQEGRDFIGIELNGKYFQSARERISNLVRTV